MITLKWACSEVGRSDGGCRSGCEVICAKRRGEQSRAEQIQLKSSLFDSTSHAYIEEKGVIEGGGWWVDDQ